MNIAEKITTLREEIRDDNEPPERMVELLESIAEAEAVDWELDLGVICKA